MRGCTGRACPGQLGRPAGRRQPQARRPSIGTLLSFVLYTLLAFELIYLRYLRACPEVTPYNILLQHALDSITLAYTLVPIYVALVSSLLLFMPYLFLLLHPYHSES